MVVLEDAALSGRRLDAWLRPTPIRIRKRFLLVCSFAAHKCGMWNGKNLAHTFVEATKRFLPFDALRQRR
jgi:hypothetical protein